jgi:YVTN family beta-propeller protein
MRGGAPGLDRRFSTGRARLRSFLERPRLVAGSLAWLPLVALGAGTALAGSSNGPAGQTGNGNHGPGAHQSDSSSGKGQPPKGSDAGRSEKGPKGTSGPNGTTLSVVSNHKTDHVWVVSTDNKSGGMSVVGSAVVNHAGSGSNAPPGSAGKDDHGKNGAGSNTTPNGGPNSPKAGSYAAHYDTDSHTVSVVDSNTNQVVANMPAHGGMPTFGAPSMPLSHNMPPSAGPGQPNGSTTHMP